MSNLSGLIAWISGIIIWLFSLERVRRSRYVLFLQTHQFHYVFFGFAAAHWSKSSLYIMPGAIFYAADIVLRNLGRYDNPEATIRVHGSEPSSKGSSHPPLITLILPVPPAASAPADHPAVTNGGSCPYLQQRGTALAAPLADCGVEMMAADPWAGTTVHVTVHRISRWWSHPFTVAGSVTLDPTVTARTGSPRALLVHIAPERRWTLELARLALSLGGGRDVYLPRVTLAGPVPMPPHIEHLAHEVIAGRPLLLVGAGSGVTPGISLLRLLASRTLPEHARVRFIVIVRSAHVAEALDGFMLPLAANGATGMPWLKTEIHLTRRAHATPSSPSGTRREVEPTSPTGPTSASSSSPTPPQPHSFRGGFRLHAVHGEDALMATPAPYLVGGGKLPPDDPHVRLARAANEHPTSRHMNVDELTTVTGACAGFLLVMWALLWKADAPLRDTPTVLNGLGGLLFAWVGSLAGASAALLFADRVGTCTYCTHLLRHLVRIARIAFRRIFGRARCSISWPIRGGWIARSTVQRTRS